MPITTPFELRNYTQHEFGKVAYEVVHHSFKVHAKLEITCIKQDLDHYLSHLRRFLQNTDLEAILWVNIVSGCLRLQRITKE